jgi:ElaB/YqjD/DUF883 family membrane-anchored ribosome-binding protein
MAVAQRKNGTSKSRRKTKRSASRRTRPLGERALARARKVMTQAVTPDIADTQAEVRQLMSDLEDRIERLNLLTKRGAGHAVDGVNDLVYGAVSGATDRVRDNAQSVTDDVTKMGSQAIRDVAAQIDKRPLLTLAIAAGIGFIAGLARRQD